MRFASGAAASKSGTVMSGQTKDDPFRRAVALGAAGCVLGARNIASTALTEMLLLRLPRA